MPNSRDEYLDKLGDAAADLERLYEQARRVDDDSLAAMENDLYALEVAISRLQSHFQSQSAPAALPRKDWLVIAQAHGACAFAPMHEHEAKALYSLLPAGTNAQLLHYNAGAWHVVESK